MLGDVVLRSRGTMTATEAAKVAGTSRSMWCDVEKGRRIPSRALLARMCGAVVGNWNEWLIAWADARLDGSLDDLRLAFATTLDPGEAEPVKQHEYAAGGTFEYREPSTVPGLFPRHIVYIDRDEKGRRRTTFVAEVYPNAIEFARALVASLPATTLDPGEAEAWTDVPGHGDKQFLAGTGPATTLDLHPEEEK